MVGIEKLSNKVILKNAFKLKKIFKEVDIYTVLNLDPGLLEDPDFLKVLEDFSVKKPKLDYPLILKAQEQYLKSLDPNLDLMSIIKNGDIDSFVEIEEKYRNRSAIRATTKHWERYIYVNVFGRMDRLHEESSVKRLGVIKKLNARQIFSMINTAGSDAYNSSFRLAYDGYDHKGPEKKYALTERIKAEFGNGYNFLKVLKPSEKEMNAFIQILSQRGRLDNFFKLIGTPEQQDEIISDLFLNLEKAKNPIEKALALRESLAAFQNNELIFPKLTNAVEKEFQRLEVTITETGDTENVKKIKEAQLLYSLVASSFYKESSIDNQWFKQMSQKYELPNLKKIENDQLFTDGVSVQQYFFYDDRSGKHWDGHTSFQNFMRTRGFRVKWDRKGKINLINPLENKGWKLEDKGSFVTLEKKNIKTSKSIRIYANKPDQENGSGDVIAYLKSQNSKPNQVVHRGHSYHAEKTIKHIQKGTPLVNLGSCGGFRNIQSVLKKSSSSQIVSTKGTGVKSVNDRLYHELDQRVLSGENLNWEDIQQKLDNVFKKNARNNNYWRSYVLPHRNFGAQLIRALKDLKEKK